MFIFGTSMKKVSSHKVHVSHHAKSAGHHTSHKSAHKVNRQAFRQNSLKSFMKVHKAVHKATHPYHAHINRPAKMMRHLPELNNRSNIIKYNATHRKLSTITHHKIASAIRRYVPLAKSMHAKTKAENHVATKSAGNKKLATKRRIEEHKAEHKVNVKVNRDLHKLSKSKKDLAKQKAELAKLKKQKAFDDEKNAKTFSKLNVQKIKAIEKKIAKDKKDIESYGRDLGKNGHKKLASIHRHTSEIQKYRDRLKRDKKAYKRTQSAENSAKYKFDVKPSKHNRILKKELLADIKKCRSLIVKHKHALKHLKKSLIKHKPHGKKDAKAKSTKKLKNEVTKKSATKSKTNNSKTTKSKTTKTTNKVKAPAKDQHTSKSVAHSHISPVAKASSSKEPASVTKASSSKKFASVAKASSSKKHASKHAKSTNFASRRSSISKPTRHASNKKHISHVKTQHVSSHSFGSASQSYTPKATSSERPTANTTSLGNRVTGGDLSASTVNSDAPTNFRQSGRSSIPTSIAETGSAASDTRFYQPPYYTQMQNGNMLMRQANGILSQTAMPINNTNNIQLIEQILINKINQLTQENQALRQNITQAQTTNKSMPSASSISRNDLSDSLNDGKPTLNNFDQSRIHEADVGDTSVTENFDQSRIHKADVGDTSATENFDQSQIHEADTGDNLLQRRAINKPKSILSEINIAGVDSRLADNNQRQFDNNSFEVNE